MKLEIDKQSPLMVSSSLPFGFPPLFLVPPFCFLFGEGRREGFPFVVLFLCVSMSPRVFWDFFQVFNLMMIIQVGKVFVGIDFIFVPLKIRADNIHDAHIFFRILNQWIRLSFRMAQFVKIRMNLSGS